MSGAELRRFVGGPFPNLVPARSPAGQAGGMAGGPFPNLALRSRSAVGGTPGTGHVGETATADRTPAPA